MNDLYYNIIMLAVVMFGFQFLFHQQYARKFPATVRSVMFFSVGSTLAGLPILWAANHFQWEFTWFSIFMAFLAAANQIAYSLCSIYALGKTNLTLYTVFSMLGGMVIPFAYGIMLAGEPLTIGKITCFLFVSAALAVITRKSGTGRITKYEWGVFLFNGMSGVLSKLFVAAPFAKVSVQGYSVLTALAALFLSLFVWYVSKGPKLHITVSVLGSMIGYGFLNRTGNLLLLIALAHLPASAQYPFVTGGVIAVSAIISCATGQKPAKQEIAAALLSVVSIAALIMIP